MRNNDFLEQSKLKIVAIHDALPLDRKVRAIITTSHFGRLTKKTYEIDNTEWNDIVLRGWIE